MQSMMLMRKSSDWCGPWEKLFKNSVQIKSFSLGCDFFERRGEKRIDIGTLLAFLKFFFSDGVLCFCHNKSVVFLALVHLQVHMCAYGRIENFFIILPDATISDI